MNHLQRAAAVTAAGEQGGSRTTQSGQLSGRTIQSGDNSELGQLSGRNVFYKFIFVYFIILILELNYK